MAFTYYFILFILSAVLSLAYVFFWQKRFNVNITAIFIIIPIVNLSYFLIYLSDEPEIMVVALKMLYFGGCFLPWFITMCVYGMCHINISRGVRLLTLLLNTGMYILILTIGHRPYYYKDYSIEKIDGVWIMHKEYGMFHSVFYIVIGCYFVATLGAIIYSYFKKKEVSRTMLYLLTIPEFVSMLGYYLNHLMKDGFEIMPLSYVFSQAVYLLITYRISMYDVSDMVIESMVESGTTGFITTTFDGRYLGSNETAKKILPKLRELTIDQRINGTEEIKNTVLHWIGHFKEENSNNKNLYRKIDGDEETIYSVKIDYLYDGFKRRGYQIFLEDDTQNQKYIKLLDQYNDELEEEVAQKTERIEQMHNNLLMGMATMVESRDNSTGGHIKRTSEGVRILINEMKKDESLHLSKSFCKSIIKAAPMHDLGKIAVDDAILRKPGRFTPEEFEQMKVHAAEGARIVHEILKDTDNEEFRHIAENVAHYHHERMDGSGYPTGLKGEDIPLEARIMAIADVYDALVSKRVYKESMSFETADKIIMEGMGSQFDPNLKKYYEAARPKLEEYYSHVDQANA